MTHTLTDKQRVILELISEGYVEKQVATYLGLSLSTVKGHTKLIRRRLGARNTTHAVAIYLRAKKASPHGNPKTTGAEPAAVVPPLRPRAALVQWLSYRAIDGARRARIIL